MPLEEPAVPVFVAPAIIAMLGVAALAAYLLWRHYRRMGLANLAADLDLKYRTFETIGESADAAARRLAPFHEVWHGEEWIARYMMTGEVGGYELALLEGVHFGPLAGLRRFRPDDESFGESITLLVLRNASLDLPHFTVKPRNIVTRTLSVDAPSPIEIDHHLGKRYDVTGDDEPRIRELFHDELQLALLESRPLVIEGRGANLLFYRQGTSLSASGARRLIEESVVLADLMETRTEAES
jgi:hypothetical protein